ncbi:leucine-zipper-like transcriptional regulator [Acrasis kona]|uniref:Leucine-zipper-like transcriptional regulator n=1 Tax=Acrasis kona TaxID=1008807 RepID=A0AAW2Z2E2_9EUKA
MIWTSRVLCSFWDANNKAQVGLLERYNHTSAIHQDKFMYLYGGLVIEHGGENSATSATTTNSFLRYNLETGEYQTLNEFIAPNFSLPSLSHHTMTVINNKMYIYGGKDRSDNPCGEVYTFDLTKEDWTKVITTSFSNTPTTPKKMDFKNYNDPTKRYGHTAVAVENSIYVFGGTDGKNYYNDIRVFDTGAYSWVTVKTHGPAPTPRSGHSCVLYGTNTLFVFGGGNDFKLFNDLYSFSMDTVTWTKITTKGSLEPVKRIHHTANVLANKMILFGGIVGDQDRQHDLMLLDLEDFRWDVSTIKQDTSTCPPSGLNAHTSALSDSSKMWVVGGKSGDTVSGLVYTLETGISVMVDPIDFGRSNLPNDLLVAVDNTCMYYDLKMNYANRTYHLHRAMLRIRCPALYQEYLRMVRANLADQPIDFESTIKKIQRRRSQPTCTQQQVSEYSQDVIFYLMEFIYTDGVSILENDEQVDNNTLSQLHTLANVLDLTRLESLISNYSNMTVPIPPPTIFADMHSLLRLCELESPVVHALDSIFDTHHDPDQDNDSNHDDKMMKKKKIPILLAYKLQ